jgi:hypothetical protein
MKLYSGIDLHSSSSYLAIIDEKGKRIPVPLQLPAPAPQASD